MWRLIVVMTWLTWLTWLCTIISGENRASIAMKLALKRCSRTGRHQSRMQFCTLYWAGWGQAHREDIRMQQIACGCAPRSGFDEDIFVPSEARNAVCVLHVREVIGLSREGPSVMLAAVETERRVEGRNGVTSGANGGVDLRVLKTNGEAGDSFVAIGETYSSV